MNCINSYTTNMNNIIELNVQPYQRQNNRVTVYPIKIRYSTNQLTEYRYTYSDFIQFSRQLHNNFNIKKSLITIKKEFNFLKKSNQKYIDRQLEIERFCEQLLLLPNDIKCSELIILFFTIPKTNNYSKSTLKRVFSLKPSIILSTPPLSPATSVLSSEDDDIKFKIVYDYQNIIIIRVSRNISLDQLRLLVTQKFALLNIELPVETLSFSYCENARYSSASSILCSDTLDTVISNEQHLAMMQTKWSGLLKITLRCRV